MSQVLNFGLSAPIDVQIEGSDLQGSFELGRVFATSSATIPGTTDVRIAQVLDYPALQIDVDRARAAQVGIAQQDVANNLLTSLSSSVAVCSLRSGSTRKNSVNYVVAVQTPQPKLASTDDLMATPLASGVQPLLQTPGAAPLTASTAATSQYLGSVARLRPTSQMALINHYTVQRVIDVQASVEGRDLGAVTTDIQRAIESLRNVPKTTHLTIRGQSESMTSSFKSLGAGLLLAIAFVYLLMVVLFQSWVDPFIIIVAVPGALIGILWMLALTHTTLNVESFMGAIMAVGIAVSNSILLVSYANEARLDGKTDALAAALEAGKTRLRPVLMTALAMMLGMLPMALGGGEGGEQNAPLGRAVIGGLMVATFVTLFIVPLVYSLLRTQPPRAHELDAQFARESHGAASNVPEPT